MIHRKRWEELNSLVYAATIFLSVFFISSIFSRLSVDPHHDGIMFKPALDVAMGKILFLDTFTQYGALTTLIQAWAIQIFGPYVVVIKILTAFFYACEAVLLWLIWRYILPTWLATLSIILWALLLPFYVAVAFPWSTVYATVFQLVSLLSIIKFLKSSKEHYLFTAGIFAALVFWCRQPLGVICLLSIISYFILIILAKPIYFKESIRKLLIYLLGSILVFFIFIIWIIYNGAFDDFWLQSIKFSLLFNDAYGPKSFLELLSIFFPYPYSNWNPGYIYDLLPLSSLILFSIVIYRIFITKIITQNNQIILLITICSLAGWHIYYPFPDFMKASWGSSLMVGAFSYLIYLLINIRNNLKKNIVVIILLFIIYMPYVYNKIPQATLYFKATNVKIKYPTILRGLLLNQEQAYNLSEISYYIDDYFLTHNNFFINVTTDALYSTFTDNSRNFHPAHVKWTLLQYRIYPNYQKALLEYVNQYKPLLLVYLPPNIQSIGVKDGFPFVFNGEETFFGYGILRRFKGGATLIAPYSCNDAINKTANFSAKDEESIKSLCIMVQPGKK